VSHINWVPTADQINSIKLDQTRSSDREPVRQVVGVVGIDRVSFLHDYLLTVNKVE